MAATRREHRLRRLSSLTAIGLLIGSVTEAHNEQDYRKPSIATSHAIVRHRLCVEDLFGQIKEQIGSNREEVFSRWGGVELVAFHLRNASISGIEFNFWIE